MSLGLLALQELLSIFNSSFSLVHSPRIWRVPAIIPLLKAGKSPSEVASFRPISLTSCVVKHLDSILADRLHYIAETNNMFSRFQAGFCKGRSRFYFNSPSSRRWLPTTPDERLRINTPWFQQSMQYGLERKTTAAHAKYWHSSNNHPFNLIFPQRPQGTSSTLRRLWLQLMLYARSTSRFRSCPLTLLVLH